MAQAVRDIRRRIKAIRNTQQITRAMQMVAAAKLRKAQELALSARTYTAKLSEVLERLTEDGAHLGHPLLTPRPVRRVTLVVVTSDRGLAGSYNTNLLRRVETVLAALRQRPGSPGADLVLIGRKGRDYFRRRSVPVLRADIGVADEELSDLARKIGGELVRSFNRGLTDEVIVIYSRFVSVLQQRPDERRLLPVARPERVTSLREGPGPGTSAGGTGADGEDLAAADGTILGRPEPAETAAPGEGAGLEDVRALAEAAEEDRDLNYIYQPEPRTVYSLLLPKFVTNQLFQAFLEARASEQAARMTAMHAATDNAQEMIEELTLTMNRARQASITQEMMELIGGADALRRG